ncbi:MAG TPA: response regulator transcription factor [Falsiroseomonas sp.]|jgi:DNA-binding response OmpR family regulator|nr:response regulator transcription factor [Falsiroseomonas sp.]
MTVAARIPVVEDEPRVADFLARGLRAEGFAVEVANDGRAGLQMARDGGFAALLLDLMLPRLGGRDVCMALRRAGDTTPVLMLTAMDALEDKVDGLGIGADDYLTKPFAFDELLARLNALIRRSRQGKRPVTSGGRVLRVADVMFDRDAMAVTRAGRPVELTGKEMALLEVLMSAPGQVFSRERILGAVWGTAEDPLTNIVDVYIRRLRRKLEEDVGGTALITTVRGHGYRFDPAFGRFVVTG